jgi:formate hydrogenlyase subunit 6/NADH:ubiquinone oxidoreductase subunit I
VAERARRARRPRPKAWIDVDGCTGCEWCVDFCPVDCIDKIDDPYYAGDGTHQVVIVDWDVCTVVPFVKKNARGTPYYGVRCRG